MRISRCSRTRTRRSRSRTRSFRPTRRPNDSSPSGELIGNIDNAKRVELLETGVINGDVKAGSLTVAAGSRMRGQVEFGYEGETRTKSDTKGFGNARNSPLARLRRARRARVRTARRRSSRA